MLMLWTNGAAIGQTNRMQALDSLITQLDSTARQHLSSQPLTDRAAGQASVRSLFTISPDTSEVMKARLRKLKYEQAVAQGDIGLDIEAGYLQNFEAGLFNVAGIFYRRRAQVGLEWNLLNNGLFENRRRAATLGRQRQQLEGNAAAALTGQSLQQLHRRIDDVFTRKRLAILSDYSALLSQQQKVMMTLYHLDYRTWDQVLEITSEKARIDRLLESTRTLSAGRNAPGAAVAYRSLPVFDINLQGLRRAVHRQRASERAAGLRAAGADAAYHPLNDISLSASLQYNFYSSAPEEQLTGISGKREFVSMSMNLSIPFPLLSGRKQDLAESQRQLARAQSRAASAADVLAPRYRRYQQQLSEYEHARAMYSKYNEQVRAQLAKQRLNDPAYSPRTLLGIIHKRYRTMLRLIDHKRSLYEQLAEIYELTYRSSFFSNLEPLEQEGSSTKRAVGKPAATKYNRSIYIWSSSFNRYDNKALADYLQSQSFDTVFLSGGTNPRWAKIRAFIMQARRRGIAVEWMSGRNVLIGKENDTALRQEIREAERAGAAGLHLDVEPQTFADWEEREDHYKRQYLDMVQQAAGLLADRDLTFSVSVPVYFDSIIVQLQKHVDQIQLMAYGTDRLSQIRTRTARERETAGPDVAVVIRPTDFDDITDFRSVLDSLSDEYNTGIHDLESLLMITNHRLRPERK